MKRKSELERENGLLRHVINQIAWMARRYADGRSTYAPKMCNEALNIAFDLNVAIEDDRTLSNPRYATDGMGFDAGERLGEVSK